MTISRFLVFCGLSFAYSSVAAQGESGMESSVPEPTHLNKVASASGSKVIRSEPIGDIESADARATVLLIEVESQEGQRVRGIRIKLEKSTSSDQIFVTESALSGFQDELTHLESSRQFDDECEATKICIRGIARCRPSQDVRQAYCPGRYSKPHSEGGLMLSTPRHSFMFPAVGIEQLGTLIAEGIQVLE